MRRITFAKNNECNIINMLSSDTMVMTQHAEAAVIYGRPACTKRGL